MFISSSLTVSNLLINVCLDYVRVQPALGPVYMEWGTPV